MKISRIGIMTACLLCMGVGIVVTSEAATSFTGSTVIGIDESQRTLTFRTKEGDKWTLPVEDPALLKPDRLAQGEEVNIEINLNDRITKIRKPSDQAQAAQNDSREENAQ